MMFEKIQLLSKNLILKKITLRLVRQADLFIIVNIQFCNKIRKRLKLFGIMLMTGLVIWEQIHQLIDVTSAVLKVILSLLKKVSNVQIAETPIQELVM